MSQQTFRRPQALHVSVALLIAIACGCSASDSKTGPAANGRSDGSAASSSDPGTIGGGTTRRPGDAITNSIGMKLVVIAPGEFQMGSPLTEEKRSGDEIQHRVRITQPFLMGFYEVTQDEFEKVMETNPSGNKQSGRQPVENVSWEQAVAFCQKLSALPEEQAVGRSYRLPTEAEWEYACRAGTTAASHYGGSLTSRQANFDGNYPYGTAEKGTFLSKSQQVGSYQPNGFGLYDMHGNVWEWCSDWYSADYYGRSAADDPQGPETGTSHVIRGGSWYNFGYACRSAYRSEFTPPLNANIYGLRVVASLGADTFEPGENPRALAKSSDVPMPDDAPKSSPASSSNSSRGSTARSGLAEPAAPPNSETASETRPISTTASIRPSIVGIVLLLLLVAFIAMMLVNLDRPVCWQNADLILLVLFASLQWLVALPSVANVAVFLMTLVLFGRVLFSDRQILSIGVGPFQPISPNLGVTSLVAILVFGSFLQLYSATTSAASAVDSESVFSRFMAVGSFVAIPAALIVLGRRWHDLRFGLSLAALYLLVPHTAIGPRDMLASAAMVWAVVFLHRPIVSGVLMGLGVSVGSFFVFLIPLWASHYLGRARFRFLTTVVALASIGLLMSFAVNGSGQPPTSGGVTGLAIEFPFLKWSLFVFHLAFSSALYFWPKRKSEPTLIVLTSAVLLCAGLGQAGSSVIVRALPWIVLIFVGGAASGKPMLTPTGMWPVFSRRVKFTFLQRDTAAAVSGSTAKPD